MNNSAISAQDQKQVIKLVTEFFREKAPDDQAVDLALGQLATLIRMPGNKLVHLGQNVFLVMVKGQGQTEVHNVSLVRNYTKFRTNLQKLINYLKGIDVSHAIIQDEDRYMERALKSLKLDYQKGAGQDGNYTYSVEI
jgi:hypothetical protein